MEDGGEEAAVVGVGFVVACLVPFRALHTRERGGTTCVETVYTVYYCVPPPSPLTNLSLSLIPKGKL